MQPATPQAPKTQILAPSPAQVTDRAGLARPGSKGAYQATTGAIPTTALPGVAMPPTDAYAHRLPPDGRSLPVPAIRPAPTAATGGIAPTVLPSPGTDLSTALHDDAQHDMIPTATSMRADPLPATHRPSIATLPQTINHFAQQGLAGSVDLALSPDDLGQIRLQMQTDGDTIRIIIAAEKPETHDLLRRHTEQFAAELRQSGFAAASFSFSSWGQPPQQPPQTPLPQAAASGGARPAAQTPPPPQSDPPSAGLDLRL